MTRRVIIVLSFDVPEPDDVAEIMTAIDPPALPHFAGVARVSVEPFAGIVEKWLDDDEKRGPHHRPPPPPKPNPAGANRAEWRHPRR